MKQEYKRVSTTEMGVTITISGNPGGPITLTQMLMAFSGLLKAWGFCFTGDIVVEED